MAAFLQGVVGGVELRKTRTRVTERDGRVYEEWEGESGEREREAVGMAKVVDWGVRAGWKYVEVSAEEGGGWVEREGEDDDGDGSGVVVVEEVCVVTYNVWFGERRKEERMRELAAEVEALDADVILLQEMTDVALTVLALSPFVMANYVLSDATGSSLVPYGVAALVHNRVDPAGFRFVQLPSNMGRRALFVTTRNPPMLIATAHLESRDNAELRKAQAELIAAQLAEAAVPISLFAGDCNVSGAAESEELAAALAPLVDTWDGVDAAFTTTMHGEEGMRIDRVFAPPPGAIAHRSLTRVGVDGAASDHMGLAFRFGV